MSCAVLVYSVGNCLCPRIQDVAVVFRLSMCLCLSLSLLPPSVGVGVVLSKSHRLAKELIRI